VTLQDTVGRRLDTLILAMDFPTLETERRVAVAVLVEQGMQPVVVLELASDTVNGTSLTFQPFAECQFKLLFLDD
jgi:hypothetical protein